MITLETALKNLSTDEKAALREINVLLSQVKHKTWVELKLKGRELREVKKDMIACEGISARHFNSIRYELDGKAQAIAKINEFQAKNLAGSIKATKSTIKKLDKSIKDSQSLLGSIKAYQLRVQLWRARPASKKKPRMPKKIQGIEAAKARKELGEARFKRHQKKRRLAILEQKLERAKSPGKTLVFGGQKLWRAGSHFEKSGFQTKGAWQQQWRFRRHSQSFWLGSHEESRRNQNAQFDPHTASIQLRVPRALETKWGKYLRLGGIFFANKQDRKRGFKHNPELMRAIHEKQIKVKKGATSERFSPLSFRILEREPGSFYIQVSFEPHPIAIQTNSTLGAIGLDLNADHIAIAETDRFGNAICHNTAPFISAGASSTQLDAILGDYVADICDRACAAGKPIVIEKLDFQKKKAGLREKGGSRYARMLSSFAFRKFQERVHSGARKRGLKVIEVNAAYTSVIGTVKYHGHKSLSSHEKAALVIARRGMRFSERPKPHGTREGTERFLGGDAPSVFLKEGRSRHVWSFYAGIAKEVRCWRQSLPYEIPGGRFESLSRPSGVYSRLRFLNERGSPRRKAECKGLREKVRRFQAGRKLLSLETQAAGVSI